MFRSTQPAYSSGLINTTEFTNSARQILDVLFAVLRHLCACGISADGCSLKQATIVLKAVVLRVPHGSSDSLLSLTDAFISSVCLR
jgi:hypothetical protein